MPHSVGENVQGNALFSPQIFRKRRLRLHHSCKHIQTYPLPPSPANKNIRQIHFEFAYFSFFLTHDKYLHTLQQMPQFPEKNHTRFQTKIGKEYTRLQTKTAQKLTRWGGTYLSRLHQGVPRTLPPPPPPPPPGLQAELLQQLAMLITKAKIRLFYPIWLWLFYAEKRILFKKFRKFRVLCLQKCIP